MQLLDQFDLPRRFAQFIPPLVSEIIVASVLIALSVGARLAIDLAFPGVVIFPLVFPAVAAATLVAGGRAGLFVIVGCQSLVWYYLMPVKDSFAFARADNAVSLVLATAAELLLLWSLTGYRAAQRKAARLQGEQNAALRHTVDALRQQAETNQKLAEQESVLQASRQRLEAIYHASGDGLTLCQAIRDAEGYVVDYQVVEVNRAHAELTGATREQMLSQKVSTIAPPVDPRWFETAHDVLKTGVMHNFDVRSPATGRWLNIRVSRVSDDLFQQTFVDVTDRHRLEEQRRELLKEMNHRVMNNFQMIASFLHVQSANADPGVKSQLQTAERRVLVLARLHSFLAYTESESDIDAAAYVKDLCGYLAASIDRPDAIHLVCETAELRLPTYKIVPLGFVISELVANSAKYAYPPPQAGAIYVSLAPRGDLWTLTIRDEGCGLGTAGTARAGGLGIRLVQRFVQQIGGELVTTSKGGVCHTISFRAEPEVANS